MSSKKETQDEVKEAVITDEVNETASVAEAGAEKKKYKPDIKNIFVLLLDYWFITLSYIFALLLLSEIDYSMLSLSYLSPVIAVTPFYALVTIVLYFVAGLYPDDYDKVSVRESRRLIFITALTVTGYSIVMKKLAIDTYPHLFYVLGGMIQFFHSLFLRYFKRIISPTGK